MSDGNWGGKYTTGLTIIGLVVAAIIAGALYFSLSAQEALSEAADQRARDNENQAEIAIQERCGPIAAAEPKAECEAQANQARQNADLDIRDLESQNAMALWTRVMGIAAVVAAGLSMFGVALIFVTFREAREGTRAAHRGADHAQHTLMHMREVAHHELHPSMVIVNESVKERFVSETEAVFDVTFTIKNTGKTAARHFYPSFETYLETDGGFDLVERSYLTPIDLISGDDYIVEKQIKLDKGFSHGSGNRVEIEIKAGFYNFAGEHWVYSQTLGFDCDDTAGGKLFTYELTQEPAEYEKQSDG